MPAGMQLLFDGRNGELKLERTFDLRDLIGQYDRQHTATSDEINACFQQAVQRRSDDVPFAISLSGGYDSRTILSAVGRARTAHSIH